MSRPAKAGRLGFASTFLKIGAIGFGGGSALIPVVEREVVDSAGYVKGDEFTEDVIIANITPGALPVKLCAAAGLRQGGIAGAFAAAALVSLPGALATVLILAALSAMGPGFLRYVEFTAFGVSAFIIFLLWRYVRRVLDEARKRGAGMVAFLVTLMAFLLTGGKEIRAIVTAFSPGLARSLGNPFFDLAMFDLLFILLFLVLSSGGRPRWNRWLGIGLTAAVFAVMAGKNGLLSHYTLLRPLLMAGMAVAALYFAGKDLGIAATGEEAAAGGRKLLGAALAFFLAMLAISLALTGPSILLTTAKGPTDGLASGGPGSPLPGGSPGELPPALRFAALAFASTLSSFGGGEAFVAVGDSFFVEPGLVNPGLVSPELYYGRIIAIANALPGPILVKVVSGIGWFAGRGAGGSALAGFLVAAAGFIIAIGSTCLAFFAVYALYRRYSGAPVFATLRTFILPLISGLLASTVLAMVAELLRVGGEAGLLPWATLVLLPVLIAMISFLHARKLLHEVAIIAVAALASLLVLAFAAAQAL
ncbi:MAG: chromate transporter [Rectinemataceae bacterium]